MRFDQACPAPDAFFAPRTPALLAAQLHPEATGQPFDGLDKAQMVDLLNERHDVAALAAAEAVEAPSALADGERRGLFVVKRAQPLHRPDPGRPQRDVVADDVDDGAALLDGHDVLGPDPSGHAVDPFAVGYAAVGFAEVGFAEV